MIGINNDIKFLSAVRSIPPKTQGNRGYFPSFKMLSEGVANYESQIERDFFLLCHHAPDVISFLHQPITIAYKNLWFSQGRVPKKYNNESRVEEISTDLLRDRVSKIRNSRLSDIYEENQGSFFKNLTFQILYF